MPGIIVVCYQKNTFTHHHARLENLHRGLQKLRWAARQLQELYPEGPRTSWWELKPSLNMTILPFFARPAFQVGWGWTLPRCHDSETWCLKRLNQSSDLINPNYFGSKIRGIMKLSANWIWYYGHDLSSGTDLIVFLDWKFGIWFPTISSFGVTTVNYWKLIAASSNICTNLKIIW